MFPSPVATLSRLCWLGLIYVKLQLLHVRAHLEYEADFWVGMLAMLLRHGAGVAFVMVLFTRVSEVRGWSQWEVLFAYGLVVLPRGLQEVFATGQWYLPGLINGGDFDRLLLRPVPRLLQVVTQDTTVSGFGNIALGAGVLAVAVRELGLQWSYGEWVFFAACIGSSFLMMVAVTLAANCLSFWSPVVTGAFPNFLNNLMELAKLPASVYGLVVQNVLTYIVPFAFISYYPSVILLQKESGQSGLGLVSPFVGPIVMLIAVIIWERGVARYQGVGH